MPRTSLNRRVRATMSRCAGSRRAPSHESRTPTAWRAPACARRRGRSHGRLGGVRARCVVQRARGVERSGARGARRVVRTGAPTRWSNGATPSTRASRSRGQSDAAVGRCRKGCSRRGCARRVRGSPPPEPTARGRRARVGRGVRARRRRRATRRARRRDDVRSARRCSFQPPRRCAGARVGAVSLREDSSTFRSPSRHASRRRRWRHLGGRGGWRARSRSGRSGEPESGAVDALEKIVLDHSFLPAERADAARALRLLDDDGHAAAADALAQMGPGKDTFDALRVAGDDYGILSSLVAVAGAGGAQEERARPLRARRPDRARRAGVPGAANRGASMRRRGGALERGLRLRRAQALRRGVIRVVPSGRASPRSCAGRSSATGARRGARSRRAIT